MSREGALAYLSNEDGLLGLHDDTSLFLDPQNPKVRYKFSSEFSSRSSCHQRRGKRKRRNNSWTYAFSTEQLFIGRLQTHVLDPGEGDTVS
jgi:hypothetical protein